MKKIIHTPDAPAAIGTYNQAVEINGFIYTSGQIGIEPGTGTLVGGGMKEQTMRVLNNIDAILTAAGLEKTSIIKLTVYLTDLKGFEAACPSPQIDASAITSLRSSSVSLFQIFCFIILTVFSVPTLHGVH